MYASEGGEPDDDDYFGYKDFRCNKGEGDTYYTEWDADAEDEWYDEDGNEHRDEG
jgi:hypothetical protein